MNIYEKLAPRYCSFTHEPMFEGWCVQDGEAYIKYESDAHNYVKAAGYADLDEAFLDDFIYYTEWMDIPEDEWDERPPEAVIKCLVDVSEFLLKNYVSDNHVNDEHVKNRCQQIINDCKS